MSQLCSPYAMTTALLARLHLLCDRLYLLQRAVQIAQLRPYLQKSRRKRPFRFLLLIGVTSRGHISTRLRVHGASAPLPFRICTEWTIRPRRFPFRGGLRPVSLPQPPKTRGARHAEVASVHGQTTPTRASRRRVAYHFRGSSRLLRGHISTRLRVHGASAPFRIYAEWTFRPRGSIPRRFGPRFSTPASEN